MQEGKEKILIILRVVSYSTFRFGEGSNNVNQTPTKTGVSPQSFLASLFFPVLASFSKAIHSRLPPVVGLRLGICTTTSSTSSTAIAVSTAVTVTTSVA